VTTFWLCREFGWTPQQARQQKAKDVERLLLVLNEWHALQMHRGPMREGTTTILITDE
jgi:hypothetical protein